MIYQSKEHEGLVKFEEQECLETSQPIISHSTSPDLVSNTKLFLYKSTALPAITQFINTISHSPTLKKFTVAPAEFNLTNLTKISQLIPSNVEFGVAQLSTPQLTECLESGLPIKFAQIDADACCALPPDLLELSKKFNIELVANHDSAPQFNLARTINLFDKRQVVYSTIYHKFE